MPLYVSTSIPTGNESLLLSNLRGLGDPPVTAGNKTINDPSVRNLVRLQAAPRTNIRYLALNQDDGIFCDDIDACAPDEQYDLIYTKGLQGCMGVAILGLHDSSEGQRPRAGYAFVHYGLWQRPNAWGPGSLGQKILDFIDQFERVVIIVGTGPDAPAGSKTQEMIGVLHSGTGISEMIGHSLEEFCLAPKLFTWFRGSLDDAVKRMQTDLTTNRDSFVNEAVYMLGKLQYTRRHTDPVLENAKTAYTDDRNGEFRALRKNPENATLKKIDDLLRIKKNEFHIFGREEHNRKLDIIEEAKRLYEEGDLQTIELRLTELTNNFRKVNRTAKLLGDVKTALLRNSQAYSNKVLNEWLKNKKNLPPRPLGELDFLYPSLK